MLDAIEILYSGEIRSHGRYIGFVTWTAPFAEQDGAGEWTRPDEDPEPDFAIEALKAQLRAILQSDGTAAERVQRLTDALEG